MVSACVVKQKGVLTNTEIHSPLRPQKALVLATNKRINRHTQLPSPKGTKRDVPNPPQMDLDCVSHCVPWTRPFQLNPSNGLSLTLKGSRRMGPLCDAKVLSSHPAMTTTPRAKDHPTALKQHAPQLCSWHTPPRTLDGCEPPPSGQGWPLSTGHKAVGFPGDYLVFCFSSNPQGH